jgi:rRNA-processing protein FCF1
MYPDQLLAKYKTKGILVDTNLLLLVAVGTYAPQRILTFKRTQQYTLDDYAMILRILERIDRRVTTANILTEVDNLARQLPEVEHFAISEAIFKIVSSSFEVYKPSIEVTQTDVYPRMGLADCVTMAAAVDDVLVLTDDFVLSNRLASIGCDVLNINHIRNLV